MEQGGPVFVGLDIGSTTVKAIVLDARREIVFQHYARHYSESRARAGELLETIHRKFPDSPTRLCLTGSGAIALSQEVGLPFVQEVIASTTCIREKIPDADVIIELGGEDAKLTFLSGGIDQRMNETCAGGTGAFIDQMAAFLRTETQGLDEMAARAQTIYPIASRCGVFAKADILPLLNEGAAPDNVAASIMQAVVNQTISGLARGRAIKGKVVFLGGPLTFLKSLQERFKSTLSDLTEAVFPENAQYFVAYGAALQAYEAQECDLGGAVARLKDAAKTALTGRLAPLFKTERERADFNRRHHVPQPENNRLAEASGRAFLGFDSGSTTIKAVLLAEDGGLLYYYYGPNQGNPLQVALDILKDIYSKKRADLEIAAAAATGYGSALLKAALKLDIDEVETVAHYTAARFFEPDVSFILDIGGQDIKCMRIRDGAIQSIQLNEACSAGCGSFIENFASSLDIPLSQFVSEALTARSPVDLGTRCTVFMNSKVKQAQKEGANIGDIAAGLSYAVVRNACYKVIKIADVAELGEHVVAQGGAFANDALLRALELEIGRNVTRPALAGLMGAFGAALLARDRHEPGTRTGLISFQEAQRFVLKSVTARCKRCTNKCLLTFSIFPDHRRFISGNRCEKGGNCAVKNDLPNLYEYKNRRLFSYYEPLSPEKARRGEIGVPRALNIYENYPLWFTILTRLGFRVVLSGPSSKEIYFKGYETIPSQTICYPAKLAHGHIISLIEQGVRRIFFPCLPHEELNFRSQNNTYNCPVVSGYPEVLAKNIGAIEEHGVEFIYDFLPLDRGFLARRLHQSAFFRDIPLKELEEAVSAGFDELDAFHRDIRDKGREALELLDAEGKNGIILVGHPYHVDPEVQHNIAELIVSCGMAVISEDAVAHLMPEPGELRVVDQWTYHSRLYHAAAFAATRPNLAVLQLVSFGCGLDAITADQIEELLEGRGRLYAQIKIDEGANLGAARIRVRSLLATMREKSRSGAVPVIREPVIPPQFTPDMVKTHTILIPQMSPCHFQFMEDVFTAEGFKVVQLPRVSREEIALGLKHVNNDACYPAIIVIGQLLSAIASGKYDLNRVALAISQTGGGCRATNYIAFLRKALVDCGLGSIPIISFSTNISATAPGLHFSGKMLRRLIMAGHYGDALLRIMHHVLPNAEDPDQARAVYDKWVLRARENIRSGSVVRFSVNMFRMIREFDRLRLKTGENRPKVGIVGEILLKYHPDANNDAVGVIEAEGGEAVTTDIMDFVLYCFYDHVFNYRHLAGSKKDYLAALTGIAFLEFTRLSPRLGFRLSRHFRAPLKFKRLVKKTEGVVSLGQQNGEGWLLAAEMIEMLDDGVDNIICMQPFGCLPNHITGKGLIKELKRLYPRANIIALDYDPGASETNQINRLKLMMTIARQERLRTTEIASRRV